MSARAKPPKLAARGLRHLRRLVDASSAGMLLGIDEDGKLSAEERTAIAAVEAACVWIDKFATADAPTDAAPSEALASSLRCHGLSGPVADFLADLDARLRRVETEEQP